MEGEKRRRLWLSFVCLTHLSASSRWDLSACACREGSTRPLPRPVPLLPAEHLCPPGEMELGVQLVFVKPGVLPPSCWAVHTGWPGSSACFG